MLIPTGNFQKRSIFGLRVVVKQKIDELLCFSYWVKGKFNINKYECITIWKA